MTSRRFHVRHHRRLVLELTEGPGLMLSASAGPPPPGADLPIHPAFGSVAHDPSTEGELGDLLRTLDSLDAAVEALRDRGFTVEEG